MRTPRRGRLHRSGPLLRRRWGGCADPCRHRAPPLYPACVGWLRVRYTRTPNAKLRALESHPDDRRRLRLAARELAQVRVQRTVAWPRRERLQCVVAELAGGQAAQLAAFECRDRHAVL